jgi:hypothetical protein
MLLCLLCIASTTWAQSKGTEDKKAPKQSAQDQRGTKQQPLVIEGIPASKPEAEAREEREHRVNQRDTGSKVSKSLEGLEGESVKTTWLTRWLVGVAIAQAILFAFQLGMMWSGFGDAKKAADAAQKSADAAVKGAMPILLPYITGHNLHPLQRITQPLSYQSALLLSFDNYGKTPATIRQFKGKLFLTVRDGPPRNLDFGDWKPTSYNVIIPGDFRGKDLVTGALDFRQEVTFTPTELDELLAEADPASLYRRFVLIGHVIYDDVFGKRHTSKFCIKLRVLLRHRSYKNNKGFRFYVSEAGIFQILQGPSEYNSVTTEKIPSPDPLVA